MNDTVIFLDIDGVLNAWSANHPQTGHQVVRDIGGFPLKLRPSDGARLLDYAVPIVWATTWIKWDEFREQVAEVVGLPAGLSKINRISDEWNSCGKLHGVEDYLMTHPDVDNFVWLDDELGRADHDFIRAWNADGRGRALGVRTSPHQGLSKKVFTVLDKFFAVE
jgi:hypothetical protein